MSAGEVENWVNDVVSLLDSAQHVVIFSGAGMSAESGISTFRQPEVGVWANKLGLAYFGTPFGWWLTPGLAWKTYLNYFRNPIARAKPNAGHVALAELEMIFKQENKDIDIITQNVDGLHQRAGSTSVFELHGSVYRHMCSKHHHLHEYQVNPIGLDDTDYDPEADPFFDSKTPPKCSNEDCSSYLRPNATLFTEGLPSLDWDLSAASIGKLRKNDLLIVIGTSGIVYPAASLPQNVAERNMSNIIEINPEPSKLTETITNQGGGSYYQTTAGTFLPLIVERYKATR